MSAPTHAVPKVHRNDLRPYAVAGLIGAAIVIVFGNTNVSAGENGGLGDALVTAAICVVLAAVLFAGILPRYAGTRTQVVLAVLTVLSLIVFWSGITPVLGAAAAAAGRRSSGSFNAAAWVGIVAAAIDVVWSVVAHFM